MTVLFCDLTGSTAIGERTDPEALRGLMNRYYDAARVVLERHGGTVEKFVGDAVMAVFGIPVATEDDALRAVRSAVELREVVHGLGLEARIGVNTGEVVAGEGDTLVTGDAVNVAARLEQAASPGEILLGEDTLQLVRDAVQVEPLELELRGKSSAVVASRLLVLDRTAGGVARDLRRPLIGRERERGRLRAEFDQVVERRACRIFTLIGPAGVGKSRLVHDFLDRVDGMATVARGRALSYGEGITYWPLVEILIQLGVEPTDVIRSSPADTQLTTRALFERLAEERPLVIVLDDLHWAEPPFLDLVEHVVDWSRERPIFLLCVARPELLDVRPGWGGGKLNATSELLDPLPVDDAEALATSLLEDVDVEPATRARILATAEGNPLFIEEMALLARDADGNVEVPPTILALLQARLDTLGEGERAVVDRGSVEGEVFHRGAVTALAGVPGHDDVPANLLSLVRKEVVRPHRTQIPGDDAFRFRHLLIRDAAYDSLPKASRAELHERFADWLEAHGDLYEQEEIVGYHLEQAARLRAELEVDDPRAAELAVRAGRHLATAGRAAFEREDLYATRSLVERAIALVPDARERRRLFPLLLHSLAESGEPSLGARLEELAHGDEADRAVATVFRVVSGPNMAEAESEHRRLDAAFRVLDEAGDELGLVFCEMARAFLFWGACQSGSAHEAYRRAYERARRGGKDALVRGLAALLLITAWMTHVSMDELEALIGDLEHDLEGDAGPLLDAILGGWRARAGYAAGAIDAQTARRVIHDEAERFEQAGMLVQASTARMFVRAAIPLAEADAAARERGLHDAAMEIAPWEHLYGANFLGDWAVSLCEVGDAGQARAVFERARALLSEGDVGDEILLLSVEALLHAHEGAPEAARARLEEAFEAAVGIDLFVSTMELAHVGVMVHALLGDLARARELLAELVALFDQRGMHRFADRFRRDLAALGH